MSVRVERTLDLTVVLDGRPAPGLSCRTGFAGAGFSGKAAAKEFTGLVGEAYFFGAVLLDPCVVLAVVLCFVLSGDVVEGLYKDHFSELSYATGEEFHLPRYPPG